MNLKSSLVMGLTETIVSRHVNFGSTQFRSCCHKCFISVRNGSYRPIMQSLQDLKRKFSKTERFAVETVSSMIAGVFAKTVSAPIDRAKVVLQTQHGWHSKRYTHTPYESLLRTFMGLKEQHGILSLWRGNLANILRFIPAQSLTFALHEQFFSAILGSRNIEDITTNTIGKYSMIAGGLSGTVTLAITYKLYYCQTHFAAHLGPLENARFKNVTQCIVESKKLGGFSNIYKGFMPSAVSIMISRAFYFGLYDFFKKRRSKEPHSYIMTWCEALVATMVSGLLGYPAETVGRRLIMESPKRHRIYENTRQCIEYIYKKEGLRGFFAGGLANSVKSFSGAVLLVFNDSIKLYLYKLYGSYKNV